MTTRDNPPLCGPASPTATRDELLTTLIAQRRRRIFSDLSNLRTHASPKRGNSTPTARTPLTWRDAIFLRWLRAVRQRRRIPPCQHNLRELLHASDCRYSRERMSANTEPTTHLSHMDHTQVTTITEHAERTNWPHSTPAPAVSQDTTLGFKTPTSMPSAM